MATKKKSNQNVQLKLLDENQWKDYMDKPGLKVVDAYSAWCGPCTAIKDYFKKLKAEVSDDLLLLATANADDISELERYRGTCSPQVLFYGGENGKNTLLRVIRGADAPEVGRVTKELIEKEHDCIQNGTARVEFKDEVENAVPVDEEKPAKAAEEVAPTKTYTVVLVKPVVAACESAEEQLDEIFAAVAEAGLKVVQDADFDFNDETNEGKLKQFFAAREGEDGFDALVESCAGEGKSKLMVLSSADGDAITLWKKLVTVSDAPAENPEGEVASAEGAENSEGDDLGAITKSVIQEKYADSVVGSATSDEADAMINAFFVDFAKEMNGSPPGDTAEPAEADKAEADATTGEVTEGEAAVVEEGEAEPNAEGSAETVPDAEGDAPPAAEAPAPDAPAPDGEEPAAEGAEAPAAAEETAPAEEGTAAAEAEVPAEAPAEAEADAPVADGADASPAEAEADAPAGETAAPAE